MTAIPAQAGIQLWSFACVLSYIPACAEMTGWGELVFV